MGSDPLALPPEQMREMGIAVVEMLIARIDRLRDGPVFKTDTLEGMRERLAAQPSSGPRDFGELLRVLDRGRPAVRRPLRPSALLRLHPGCRHLARRPR